MPDWHATTEPRADGRTSVRLYRFVPVDGGPDQHERAEYVISHEDAWHLLLNLAGQLRSDSDVRMRNAAAGDCETCGNHRLTDAPRTNGPGTSAPPDVRFGEESVLLVPLALAPALLAAVQEQVNYWRANPPNGGRD